MKNILVSTDFSKQAFTAAVFAAELARSTGARLILFHAYHPAVLLEEAYIWANTDKLEEEVQQKIDSLAQTLHGIYGVSITRLLKPGFAVDEILYISKKINPDLLVLGTEGAGIRPTETVGKVTAELLKRSEVPMVCIPPDATFESFSQLAQHSDSNLPLGNTAGLHLFQRYLSGTPASSLAAGTTEKSTASETFTNIIPDIELGTAGLAPA